jgi:uncharacterized protein YdaU (DUF1376 family)
MVMAGLSRFDFYPRDWHLDTRDLSNAAKGIYIDLLSAMYARGGPLPNDERGLCRLCGCATARSLRPLLQELVDKQKLKAVDGHLVNNRVMEEIAKAERRQAVASSGGHAKAEAETAARELSGSHQKQDAASSRDPTGADRQRRHRERSRNGVQPEFGSNSARTRSETRAEIEENQEDKVCSPSPSPSTGTKVPAAGAAFDPEKPVFDYGKQVLGKSAGGQIKNLIRHYGGDLAATVNTLRVAARKQNPREYVGGILAGSRKPEIDWDAEYRRMGVAL